MLESQEMGKQGRSPARRPAVHPTLRTSLALNRLTSIRLRGSFLIFGRGSPEGRGAVCPVDGVTTRRTFALTGIDRIGLQTIRRISASNCGNGTKSPQASSPRLDDGRALLSRILTELEEAAGGGVIGRCGAARLGGLGDLAPALEAGIAEPMPQQADAQIWTTVWGQTSLTASGSPSTRLIQLPHGWKAPKIRDALAGQPPAARLSAWNP